MKTYSVFTEKIIIRLRLARMYATPIFLRRIESQLKKEKKNVKKTEMTTGGTMRSMISDGSQC